MMIKPFYAIRPKEAYVKQVAALPYDAVTDAEAREAMANNPCSFLNVDKAATAQEARQYLDDMIARGIYEEEEMASFYLYGLETEASSQYGIVGCFSCEAYETGRIKKHEKTRQDKEDERIAHVATCKAHTGPIFMAYKEQTPLEGLIVDYRQTHQPLYDFTDEKGLRQVIYRLDTADHTLVQATFETLSGLYIADGHHRAAAACAYARNNAGTDKEKDYFLGVAFQKDQLEIMAYNRVMTLETAPNKAAYFDALTQYFEVEEVPEVTFKPSRKGVFGMRYQQQWYALTLKAAYATNDAIEGLDVACLQRYVLAPVFGVKEPRTDKRLAFVGGIRGVEVLNEMSQQPNQIAFSLYPTALDELIRVADEGGLMPPKSTWFEPKLRSGLFIHRI